MPEEPAEPGSAPVDRPTFEGELDRLEACVRKLESGDVSLEEALRLYEEGMALAARCQTQLEAAEARVAQLVRGQRGIEERPLEDVEDP